MNFGFFRKKWDLRKAASASHVGQAETPVAPKDKYQHVNQTKYGQKREVVVGGKALKEVEVTGEKQQESIPDKPRHRKISRSRRKAEFEGDELKVQCRDLAPADYEGWLHKKSSGPGLTTWKQCWVVLKNGILYLFKTSFDIAAQHAYSVRNFSVAPIEDKRKFTFKLFPKNVPPEALRDAKGVIFSCESAADVEKWCDVLNKAALGFIIQPATQPEQDPDGHRLRSSTFTGETTGLPSAFTRTSSASRTRKVSQPGTPSSVLAVGTMFRVLDDPEDKAESSNGELNSILYKDNRQSSEESDVKVTGQKSPKRSPMNGPTEEEVRMQVKKEVERINKQAKPVKVVEGNNANTAATKKADIIRLEIQNLKESQRLMDTEAIQNEDNERNGAVEEEETTALSSEDVSVNEEESEIVASVVKEEDLKIDMSKIEEAGEDVTIPVEDNTKEDENNEEDVGQAMSIDVVVTVNALAGEEGEMKNVVSAVSTDSGVDSVHDLDDMTVEEYLLKMEKPMKELPEKEEEGVGVSVEDYLRANQPQNVEEPEEDLPEEVGMSVEDYLKAAELQAVEESTEDLPANEEEGEIGVSVEDYLKNAELQAVEESTEELPANEEEVEIGVSVEDYLKSAEKEDDQESEVSREESLNVAEQSVTETSIDDYLKSFEEEGKDESESVEPKIESVTHASMIPARQQRMLIDAVASLDYPSENESESTSCSDEVCHYAKIERPSVSEAEKDAQIDDGDDNDKEANDDLDVVIGAPPEFQDDDAKHHSLSRVKEHAVQYGATEEEKFIVHHTYIRENVDEEITVTNDTEAVDQNEARDAGTKQLRSADPFTVYCDDENNEMATEEVLPMTSVDGLASFEEKLNQLIEEEDQMLEELKQAEEKNGEEDPDTKTSVTLVEKHETKIVIEFKTVEKQIDNNNQIASSPTKQVIEFAKVEDDVVKDSTNDAAVKQHESAV
eukprot:gene359-992_t